MKVALFDLDGVVFNTEPQYTVFWGQIFKEYYPDKPELSGNIKGSTLVQIYDKYFKDKKDTQAEITHRLDEFEENMHFDYVPGFEDFVTGLRKNGVHTAVVTSSNRQKMNNVYSKHPEFKGYFDAILTSEDFSESKPSPDCYIKGAERFGANPKDCVVFEDSFNGLKAGRASGAYVVGLATTNSAEDIAPLCDKVIENYLNFKI